MDDNEKIDNIPKQLFQQHQIQEGQGPNSLSQIRDIKQIIEISDKLYIRSENRVVTFHDKKIQCEFEPFTDSLYVILGVRQYLFCYGVDKDPNSNQKSTYLKIYDLEKQTKLDSQCSTCSKKLIGKQNSPLPFNNQDSFKINDDLTCVAIGQQDGSIILYKSKDIVNDSSLKESVENYDSKNTILDVHFVKDKKEGADSKENQWHLYYNCKSGLYCITNLNLRNRKLVESKQYSNCEPNNYRGTLFGVDKETQKIVEFNTVEKVKTISAFDKDKDKQIIKTFHKNYLIMVVTQWIKDTQSNQITIYDIDNRYIAYKNQNQFKYITHVIIGQEKIYIVAMLQDFTRKNEKKYDVEKNDWHFFELTEDDNNAKLQKFFSQHSFDLALRFAINNGASKQQQAEISRMHGDHLYSKGDFENSITHYLKTTGYIETSYVNRKFLQVQHMKYLIKYLEEIHNKRKQDKHHTAQLLNCYVKTKEIKKLEDFIQGQSYDSDLFDTETAIQVCRDLDHIDLALKLAENNENYTELYIKIMVERKKNEVLNYIQTKLKLQNKIKYIREFGQVLMKDQQKQCLEFIKKLVILSLMKNHRIDVNNLTEQQQMLQSYFNLSTKDWEELGQTEFPKPDHFFNFFYSSNDDQLREYLEFLIKEKGIQDEKAIFKRLFEIYLAEYQKLIENVSIRKLQPEADQDVVKKKEAIMNLLENSDKKYLHDDNQLLVLFKMHNFEQGIIYLCENKKQLNDQLLHYYMSKEDKRNENIERMLEICGKQKEGDLWIQTLKYILKKHMTTKNDMSEQIKKVMRNISQIDDLSPLMVLNIIQSIYKENKEKGDHENTNMIKFQHVKKYFIEKMQASVHEMEQDKETTDDNLKLQKESMDQYRTLKTQAKIFQAQKCSHCEGRLKNPSVHFRCGHSYEETCVIEENGKRECQICMDEHKRIIQRKENYEQRSSNDKMFQENFLEKLSQNKKNNFDIISDFMGKGIFKKKDEILGQF